MLKIFTTQLLGVFNTIQANNEMEIEDSARLIAQTLISEGKVYVHECGISHGIAGEAVSGKNRLPKTDLLIKEGYTAEVDVADCVIISTDAAESHNALILTEQLKEKGCTVIGISGCEAEGESLFKDIVDVHLNYGKNSPIVPLNDHKKIGQPSAVAALYTYYILYLTIMEILDEQDFLRIL
ncbi:uncharacterized protein DUF2529 [Scopulibacillus darangshiensis]|uniref:Uncharacterized protein DUF2529 n=1 Tax=Scopulibacillus darangshiensis TaxID=442528 RepID=A0A4R2NNZ6_9BACL|nr:DUF2529 family protein [Scopulibacillus darangshiensis]TCP23005.1 uncharacterized protein DUF2529 [Scopulibacillus darangshiensis]